MREFSRGQTDVTRISYTEVGLSAKNESFWAITGIILTLTQCFYHSAALLRYEAA